MRFLKGLKSLLEFKSSQGFNPDLDEFQTIIGYRFSDPALLVQGLTHRSACRGGSNGIESNERLEFLGDSVLGLVIAEQLFRDHPELREGELTKTKALLVNETTLATIGKDIGLNRFVLLSDDEDRSGGRNRFSIISDAFESVIGAVFLDGGILAARDLVFRLIYCNKQDVLSDKSQRNSKGELLEWVQARGDGMPRYHVISEEGPDHHKVFHIEVYIAGEKFGSGTGRSKKEAEQKAAADSLDKISLGDDSIPQQ